MKKNLKLLIVLLISSVLACFVLSTVTYFRFNQIENKYEKLKSFNQIFNNLKNDTNTTASEDLADKLAKLVADSKFSADICKLVESNNEDYMFVFISLPLTLFIYIYNSFWCSRNHAYLCKFGKVKVKHNKRTNGDGVIFRGQENEYENTKNWKSDASESTSLADSIEKPAIKESSIVCSKIKNLLFKFKQNRKDKTKRLAFCCCTCRFDVISPMNPFGKRNRFITAIIYAAYTYNVLKIFENLLLGESWYDQTTSAADKIETVKDKISTLNPTNVGSVILNFTSLQRGILTDLLKQVLDVVIIGLRYYPILLCVEMKNKRALCYFFCSLYMWLLFAFHFYTNTFCLFFDSNDNDMLDISKTNSSKNITSFLNQFYNENFKKNFTFFKLSNFDTLDADNSTNITNFTSTSEMTTNEMTSNVYRRIRENTEETTLPIELVYKPLQGLKNLVNINLNITFNKKELNITNQTSSNLTNELDNEFAMNKHLILRNNILYEKLIFYLVLCIIMIHLTIETIVLVSKKLRNLVIFCRKLKKKEINKSKRVQIISSILFNDDSNREYIEKTINNDIEENRKSFIQDKPIEETPEYKSAEMLYTAKLFERRLKSKSYAKYLFERYFYHFKMHFKYPKQLINTYVIAYILLYYLTCILIRKSKLIIDLMNELLIMFINFLFKITSSNKITGNMVENEAILAAASTTQTHLSLVVNYIFSNIESTIIIACSLTTSVYVFQLFLGIKSYQKHILQAYRGKLIVAFCFIFLILFLFSRSLY